MNIQEEEQQAGGAREQERPIKEDLVDLVIRGKVKSNQFKAKKTTKAIPRAFFSLIGF